MPELSRVLAMGLGLADERCGAGDGFAFVRPAGGEIIGIGIGIGANHGRAVNVDVDVDVDRNRRCIGFRPPRRWIVGRRTATQLCEVALTVSFSLGRGIGRLIARGRTEDRVVLRHLTFR